MPVAIHPSAGRAQGFQAFLRAIHHLPSPARRLLGHRFWAKEGGDRCWLRVWVSMFFCDSSTPRDTSCCHVYRNLAGDETNSVENTCVRVVGQKKHCRDTIDLSEYNQAGNV